MLFDKHTDGPYLELIQKAYSPNHPVIRHQHYKGKKVRVDLFHYFLFISFRRSESIRIYIIISVITIIIVVIIISVITIIIVVIIIGITKMIIIMIIVIIIMIIIIIIIIITTIIMTIMKITITIIIIIIMIILLSFSVFFYNSDAGSFQASCVSP